MQIPAAAYPGPSGREPRTPQTGREEARWPPGSGASPGAVDALAGELAEAAPAGEFRAGGRRASQRTRSRRSPPSRPPPSCSPNGEASVLQALPTSVSQACLERASSAAACARSIAVSFGCEQVWQPISQPLAARRRTSSQDMQRNSSSWSVPTHCASVDQVIGAASAAKSVGTKSVAGTSSASRTGRPRSSTEWNASSKVTTSLRSAELEAECLREREGPVTPA